jgi:hypothetical protein
LECRKNYQGTVGCSERGEQDDMEIGDSIGKNRSEEKLHISVFLIDPILNGVFVRFF